MKKKGIWKIFNGGNGRFKTESPRKAMEHARVKEVLADAGNYFVETQVLQSLKGHPIEVLKGFEMPTVVVRGTSALMEVSTGYPTRVTNGGKGYFVWHGTKGTVTVRALQEELASGKERAYFEVESWFNGRKSAPHYEGITDGPVKDATLKEYVGDAMKYLVRGSLSGLPTLKREDAPGPRRYSGRRDGRNGPVNVPAHTRGLPYRR